MIFPAELKSKRSGNGTKGGPEENVRWNFGRLLLDAAGYWSLSMLFARCCFRIGVHDVLRQGNWLPFTILGIEIMSLRVDPSCFVTSLTNSALRVRQNISQNPKTMAGVSRCNLRRSLRA